MTYPENLTSTEFLEHQDSVAAYRTVLGQLNRTALDHSRSRDWLVNTGERRVHFRPGVSSRRQGVAS